MSAVIMAQNTGTAGWGVLLSTSPHTPNHHALTRRSLDMLPDQQRGYFLQNNPETWVHVFSPVEARGRAARLLGMAARMVYLHSSGERLRLWLIMGSWFNVSTRR